MNCASPQNSSRIPQAHIIFSAQHCLRANSCRPRSRSFTPRSVSTLLLSTITRLAACLMNMGRDREALAEIETAARLDPSKELYNARKEELLRLMKSPGVQHR